jgi:hypothetical protein
MLPLEGVDIVRDQCVLDRFVIMETVGNTRRLIMVGGARSTASKKVWDELPSEIIFVRYTEIIDSHEYRLNLMASKHTSKK